MKLHLVVLAGLIAWSIHPQEVPRAQTRPSAPDIERRTSQADFLGTVRVASDDLYGGGFNGATGGNPTVTLVVVNGDARRALTSLEGFVGFSTRSTNRVIGVKAKTQRETSPGTWEADAIVGNVAVDDHGVIGITDLASAPGVRLQLFIDLARTPDAPFAFGFRVGYR